MKIWAIILIILSLSKLCIVGSQEKQNLAKDLLYQIRDNLDNFQKKAVLILTIDSIVGLTCGAIILFIL
jgi:hypothetical protein